MKSKVIRVAVSYATLADTNLNAFAILVLACLKTNTLFPNLPVTIAALQAVQTAFQNALTAAAQGGPQQTAAKNEVRAVLVAALRQNASYVQSLNLQNESQVLSSGYDIISANTQQTPLDTPVIRSLDNSQSAKIFVDLQAVTNAKAYLVQAATGTGAWQTVGIFPNTRDIVLEDQVPGTMVRVQVQAIGGSTGASAWSNPVSKMAT